MKAIIVEAESRTLKLSDKPLPEPGENEVRIRVEAAGVNRPDIFQRKGNYPAPPGVDPDIPGLEVSGRIESLGSNVTGFATGDKVCALLAGGGYAEYAVADQRQVLPVPASLSVTEAGGLCETIFTVWNNVFDLGRFREGEKVLVHGGTSGIGVTAIQLITSLGGKVFVTCGSDEKCGFAESLGAAKAVNYKTEDFEEALKSEGVDIILDMIGGDYTPKNIRLLCEEGRLVMINAMKGREASVDLLRVMRKRLTLTGSTLRARDAEFKGKIRDALLANAWPRIAEGLIRPVVYKTFRLENAMDAHALMEAGDHMGKIILTV